MIQLFAAGRSLHIIINSGTYKDIRAFLNEYWRWDHLRENSLMLSLWVTSFSAYVSLWLITLNLDDLPIAEAFNQSPFPCLYIVIAFIGLLIHTAIRSKDQITSTQQTVKDLKKMRMYRSFKSVLKKVQNAPINATSWGNWVGTIATATEWVSEHFVKRKIDADMKDALIKFGALATLEYLFRMSIVAVAVWITYQ